MGTAVQCEQILQNCQRSLAKSLAENWPTITTRPTPSTGGSRGHLDDPRGRPCWGWRPTPRPLDDRRLETRQPTPGATRHATRHATSPALPPWIISTTCGSTFERRRASGSRDDTSTTDVVEMPDPDPRLPTPDIEHAPRLVATMADDIETFEHAPPRLEIVPPRVGEDAPQT